MELATFSDVEFVGIAADRHVVVDSNHRGRRESTSGSSTISLASAGSEIQRSVHITASFPQASTDLSSPAGTTKA